MKYVKIIRPALSLVLCLAAIVLCLTSASKFSTETGSADRVLGSNLSAGDYGYTVTYSYSYGGDAYTGIQNAGADASNNVAALGLNVTEAANRLLSAQKTTGNNVAALMGPMNTMVGNVATMGSLLCTMIAFAFAIPGVKNLMDLILAVLELKASAVAEEVPAEEVQA